MKKQVKDQKDTFGEKMSFITLLYSFSVDRDDVASALRVIRRIYYLPANSCLAKCRLKGHIQEGYSSNCACGLVLDVVYISNPVLLPVVEEITIKQLSPEFDQISSHFLMAYHDVLFFNADGHKNKHEKILWGLRK